MIRKPFNPRTITRTLFGRVDVGSIELRWSTFACDLFVLTVTDPSERAESLFSGFVRRNTRVDLEGWSADQAFYI